MAKFGSSYIYAEDRNEWIGVVYESRPFRGRLVLTVGVMDTEQGIKVWLAEVLRRRAWETKTEPPDKYTQLNA